MIVRFNEKRIHPFLSETVIDFKKSRYNNAFFGVRLDEASLCLVSFMAYLPF